MSWLPTLTERQVLVVTTGYWAALRNRELLEKYGAFDKFVFTEMNIMPYLSGKIGPAEVEIGNYKRELHISAWPATGNDRALEMVRRVYPQTVVHKNILELNFWPGNPGVHPQITLPNAVFFFERAREFRFYGEVSRSASKLTDAHDRERMAIAAAYECDSVTWPEDCRRKYLYEGEKLHDIHGSVRDPHAQKWNRIEEIERLLVEDLCYSFIPMEALAAVAGMSDAGDDGDGGHPGGADRLRLPGGGIDIGGPGLRRYEPGRDHRICYLRSVIVLCYLVVPEPDSGECGRGLLGQGPQSRR